MTALIKTHLIALLLSVVAVAAAEAQDAPAPALIVELNTAQTIEGVCRLSFLIQNEHPQEISKVIYETVLFDTTGSVNQLTLFDFGQLPVSRPRVRQFDVAQLACENLGQILINGATTCNAGTLSPDICTTTLELKSRTDIKVLG